MGITNTKFLKGKQTLAITHSDVKYTVKASSKQELHIYKGN